MVRPNGATSTPNTPFKRGVKVPPAPQILLDWRAALDQDGYDLATVKNFLAHVWAVCRELGIDPRDVTTKHAALWSAQRGHSTGTAANVASRVAQFAYWLDTGLTRRGSLASIATEMVAFKTWLMEGEARKGVTTREPLAERSAHTYMERISFVASGCGRHPRNVKPKHLKSYLANRISERTGRPLTQDTKNVTVWSFTLYSRYAKIANPGAKIPRPRRKARMATGKAVSDVGLRLMLDRATRTLYTMLALGAFCGLRVHEIGRIHHEHIKLTWQDGITGSVLLGAEITVWNGKGGVDRRVPLDAQAAQTLTELTLWDATKRGPIFNCPQAKQQAGAYVSNTVGKFGKGLGLADFHGHQLRHWFAVRTFERSGHNILAVQRWLGHANLNTTQVYLASLVTVDAVPLLALVSHNPDAVLPAVPFLALAA